MIALAVVALLGAAALNWATSGLRLARKATESEQAFYMANAGIEDGLARVLAGQAAVSFSRQLPIAGSLSGTYSVTMTAQPDQSLAVVSTGQVGKTTRVVTARMVPGTAGSGTGSPDGSVPPPPGVPEQVFQQAIFSNGSLAFDNNSVICGDLLAVGSITLGNGTRVVGTAGSGCSYVVGTGKVIATGLVELGNNATVAGGWCDYWRWGTTANPCPTRPTASPLSPPNFAALSARATVRSGSSLTLAGSKSYHNDVVYIEGNLLVDKVGVALSGTVTFVATGSANLEGDLTCAGACNVAIISRGDITSGNNLVFRSTLVSTGRIALGNSATVHGNLQAGSFAVLNNATVYPLKAGATPSAPGGLTNWK
jgi:type II secretory pathway pseudopilin PulG